MEESLSDLFWFLQTIGYRQSKNHVSFASLLKFAWMQSPVELHSQPNMLAQQSSVFNINDLKLSWLIL